MKLIKTPLVAAVAALFVAPVALADLTIEKSYDETVSVDSSSSATVVINKKVDVEKKLRLEGQIWIDGAVTGVNAAAMAVADDKQVSHDNIGTNSGSLNDAFVGQDSLQNSTGNIGLNVAAGDNNAQSNAATLAALDFGQVFTSSVDAELFVNQDGARNDVVNDFVDNLATADTGFMNGSSGNLGANIAAGTSNLQKNNLVVAAAGNVALAEATASVLQQTGENVVDNIDTFNTATLGIGSLNGVSGNVGVNIAAGSTNAQSNSLTIAVGGL